MKGTVLREMKARRSITVTAIYEVLPNTPNELHQLLLSIYENTPIPFSRKHIPVSELSTDRPSPHEGHRYLSGDTSTEMVQRVYIHSLPTNHFSVRTLGGALHHFLHIKASQQQMQSNQYVTMTSVLQSELC